MLTYLQAKAEHHGVAAEAAKSEPLASSLWSAVTLGVSGKAAAAAYVYADAVRDTVSAEQAMLIAANETAAVWAFALHAQAYAHREEVYQDVHHVSGQTRQPFELRGDARGVWEAFDTKAKSVEELARGFGWDLSLAWKTFADVATRDANEVRRIASLAGRMYAALRGALAAQVHGVPEEVHSIELGNDIVRLLPPELAQLADPELELPVLARIVEKRALQYAVRGSGEASKGPLVLCLDESGSMHDARRVWSKSAALAVARVAHEQKRSVSVVHFSSGCTARKLDPSSPASVLEMIRHWYDGGTDIALALRVAADEVGKFEKGGQKGADVILVTDGVDGNEGAQAEAVALLAKRAARLWTVAVECDISPASPLRKTCAGYERVGDGRLEDATSVGAFGGAVKP